MDSFFISTWLAVEISSVAGVLIAPLLRLRGDRLWAVRHSFLGAVPGLALAGLAAMRAYIDNPGRHMGEGGTPSGAYGLLLVGTALSLALGLAALLVSYVEVPLSRGGPLVEIVRIVHGVAWLMTGGVFLLMLAAPIFLAT